MASASSAVRKCVFGGQALVLLVLLLSWEATRVNATCDVQKIGSSLSACIPDLHKSPSTQCCSQLQYIKKVVNPDDPCICSILTSPTVKNAGLTKEEAANFINICVGSDALPSCLR